MTLPRRASPPWRPSCRTGTPSRNWARRSTSSSRTPRCGVGGYSAGAGLALRLAIQRPGDVVACAAVEGNFGEDEPDRPPELCVEFITANLEAHDRLVWIR